MSDVGTESEANLTTESGGPFATRVDALWFLAGLAGFWGGFAVICVAAVAGWPSLFVLAGFVVVAAGAMAQGRSTRRLEERISGRTVRAWPFGYPSFRTQVVATLPPTVVAAARRLDWDARLVVGLIYGLLAIDLVALVVLFSSHR